MSSNGTDNNSILSRGFRTLSDNVIIVGNKKTNKIPLIKRREAALSLRDPCVPFFSHSSLISPNLSPPPLNSLTRPAVFYSHRRP